ncbi:MAG TPA: phenylalanine--tRNA ligase subunit beta, partial [bacterium]|nr:phenylalanine--tRNA ligase subunit beta [bacterium]
MKILKSWLKDYISIEDLSDREIEDKVTFGGIEVEGIEKSIDDLVVVAEIVEIKPHPNADRLRLAKVVTGEDEIEVVCGAPNIKVGQKVSLAQIGAILPGGFEIKKAEIRGVESYGMLCAADELGLGSDHSGIIILANDTKIGQRVNEIVECKTVFDLKPTPNRGDCFSHLGIAREIAALTNRKNTLPAPPRPAKENTDLKVMIEDGRDCPRYYAANICDVKVGPSPEWLQKRLLAVGAKPINNIVDVTNYIMLDLGQPLHAFDARKIAGEKIGVRRARNDEEITIIDGTVRKLSSDNLLITDSEKAIAIAGVMGGKNSEISDSTIDIILEAAEFTPSVIRKSAKKLGISTDASYHFERGVDPLGVQKALLKAIEVILDVAGGEVNGITESVAIEYQEKSIEIPYDKINSLLGLTLGTAEIDKHLSRLGFTVQSNNLAMKQFSNCIIPSWRRDVSIWQDLAEEVGRVFGLNNIAAKPLTPIREPSFSDYHKKEYFKDLLLECGFSEVATYSIISEADAKTANLHTNELLEIANPVQPENKYMRNSLIPGLLKVVAKNGTFDPLFIFEIGNVFSKDFELTNLAIVAAGKNAKKEIHSAVEQIESELNIERKIDIKELPV